MNPRGFFIALAVTGLIAGTVSADVVHLKDGTTLDGDLKHSIDDGWDIHTDGKTVHVSTEQVESIELTGGAAGPAQAVERLVSLRRSVENVSGLPEIVARFQRFVDTCNEPSVASDAKKDLAVWQDRVAQKMVKIGGKWVSPGDRQKILDQAEASVEQARQLIKQGRSKEADALLVDALVIDPQNPGALYLVGGLRYQQEQLPAARKALEAVAAAVPNHAPTLNNLALVQWRQRQYIPALSHYDDAMLASPVNRLILDNVASAMLALPAELQKSPVAVRVLRHFQEQDAQLADQLRPAGLHRNGAIWVTDQDMDRMHILDRQTQEKLDLLSGNFDQIKAHVGQLDQNISENQSQIDRIVATSVISDARTGIPIQMPYPPVYFQLSRDLQQMQLERAGDVSKMDAMKRQADDLQLNRPSQMFGGMQRMIGPEGTPMRIPSATQPANP